MNNESFKNILIGAHTSSSGGVHNSLLSGWKIGATTVQLFTANQRTWFPKKIEEKSLALWNKAKIQTKISITASHASYLINLASPKEEIQKKSLHCLKSEIFRCHALEVNYLVLHPGASTGDSLPNALNRIISHISSIYPILEKGPTQLALETTAGQGTTIGSRFEELAHIVQKFSSKQIGICLDTCHVFAAGYDIRTSWSEILREYQKKIGTHYLLLMHVNDSLHPLGSKKDRHVNLGEGHLGWTCFKSLMQCHELQYLPKYLETPNPEKWPEEIKKLKHFAQITPSNE